MLYREDVMMKKNVLSDTCCSNQKEYMPKWDGQKKKKEKTVM